MNDDTFFTLLGIAAFFGLLLGPVAFFMAFGARQRLRIAESRIIELAMRLRGLETGSGIPAPATPAPYAPAAEAADEIPMTTAPSEPLLVSEPTALPEPPAHETGPSEPDPSSAAWAPAEARPRRSLEERLGTRWTVWVGGIALGLGALLLVRYSIEAGFFGPGTRIFMGLLLAIALAGAGEWLRRKEGASLNAPANAYIPGVLTAAGAVAAFGAIYAAYALYGFIGPTLAFLALGLTGLACLVAAGLHGPGLAGLGLIASFATPLLVSSEAPNPWPLIVYLGVVAAAAYGLARLRRWLWLALAAAAGGGVWAAIMALGPFPVDGFAASVTHVVVQLALAVWFLVIDPHREATDEAPADPVAVLVPAAFALVALWIFTDRPMETVFILGALAVALLLAIPGLLRSPATALTAVASVFVVALLHVWPGVTAINPNWPLPDFGLHTMPPPASPRTYAIFALVLTLGLAALCGRKLLAGTPLRAPNGWLLAASGTLAPLLALIVAFARMGRFETDFLFAAIACGLGVVFVFGATIFRQRLDANAPSQDNAPLTIGLGASASATIAALALALVFALQGGTLTVALALAALGAAYVSVTLDIRALRWCVTGLGIAVAARLAWEPRVVGAALGATPVFNWLLFGYGVPALAFGYAARLMRRGGGEDTPVRVAQSLAILLSGFLIAFEIRHALNGGDIAADESSLAEQGLMAFSALGFAAVLTRLDRARSSIVFRLASYGFGIASFFGAVVGLFGFANPFFSGETLAGGPLVNTLLLGYGLPTLAAFALARLAVNVRPAWYVAGARILTIALTFAWLTLEVRRIFQGPGLGFWHSTSDAEFYTYSLAWLGFGLVLLAWGIWRGSREARLASALFVILTVLKVFLFDLAGLEGLLRALSFIGLGLVLIGIGLVYQKLVFARPSPTPSDVV